MVRAALIGDEVTSAGFRLAGAVVYSPEQSEVAEFFQQARKENDLIIITAEYAQYIPDSILSTALRAEQPLILLVPDVRNVMSPPDLVALSRRTLGIES